MRYLWIEDFNEGYNESELKDKWIRYYNLTASDLIIKKNLNSALKYIEENPEGFDTVLLDINLPIGESIDGKDYKDYLRDIVSDKYLNMDSDDIQRKAGFLIFLKLMLDLRFPKERIVFLTGNVDLSKIIEIDNIISFYSYYLYDKKIRTYEEFMEAIDKVDEDYDYYESCKVDLKRQYPELYKKLDSVIEKENDIRKWINLLRTEKERLLGEKKISEDPIKPSGNTYNRMETVFIEAGFNPPRAFEKPTESVYDKFNWDFLEWKKSIEHPYYELRSSIVEMCQILINRLKEMDDDELDKFIIFNKLYLNSYTADEKKNMYSRKYFQELLQYIQRLFPCSFPATEEERRSIYRQVIKEISHDWETAITVYYPNKAQFEKYKYRLQQGSLNGNGCKLYEYCDSFRDFAQKSAYGAIMKIIRNWTSHSKLRDFNEAEVGFLFIIAMRSFFELGNKFDTNYYEEDKDKNYNYYELKLLQLANKGLRYDDLVDKFKKRKNKKDELYREIEYDLKRSFDLLSREDPKNYLFSYDIYAKIRNIGDEDSKAQCRMEHIYKLFWHFMFNSYLDYYNGKYTNPNLKFCLDDELCVTDKEDVLTYLYMYSWN
ncbi:MAG: hypothetical protein GX895_02635 [Clostridiales bacterium]|uniref:hypothetical protein n=1 Tax=Clostridium sp. N3C TaxID=1776758 RepID=UPI00092DFF66|nr:hypothetical protein [Clostridium sp. N3C]NLZ47680.1 hypothetical protein [Clostridiales bacterium]SCN22851.1 hypothetical protein N3C_0992 [Clostridium sp. N3C]